VSVSFPLLPLLVFVAEVCVVTLSTMRTIFIARGMKGLAPFIGFFEIVIWLFAIGQIMRNLNDPACYVAFAAGFTLGNFLGVMIEKRLGFGSVLVRVITGKDPADLTEGLRAAGYGVTSLDGQGATGPVKVVFTVIKRKELGNVVGIVKGFDPKAFYSVDDLQSAASGVSPEPRGRARAVVPDVVRLFTSAD
jgi:uncharacterized protein YebE (UPF0316 family)